MALDILKITMQYCCALKQEDNKKYKVIYFLSFRDNDSICYWGHSSFCVQYLYNYFLLIWK